MIARQYKTSEIQGTEMLQAGGLVVLGVLYTRPGRCGDLSMEIRNPRTGVVSFRICDELLGNVKAFQVRVYSENDGGFQNLSQIICGGMTVKEIIDSDVEYITRTAIRLRLTCIMYSVDENLLFSSPKIREKAETSVEVSRYVTKKLNELNGILVQPITAAQ